MLIAKVPNRYLRKLFNQIFCFTSLIFTSKTRKRHVLSKIQFKSSTKATKKVLKKLLFTLKTYIEPHLTNKLG